MSKIEWTEKTWNPMSGCTHVSEGCRNCYAEKMAYRLKAMGTRGYENGFKVTLHPDALEIPLHWHKPRMIFVGSMGDLFHKDVPFEYIDRVFAVMALCPQHTFQVLTKRADRMEEYINSRFNSIEGLREGLRALLNLAKKMKVRSGWEDVLGAVPVFPQPLPNVWLGTSVENEDNLTRVDVLRGSPAASRFLSLEPLLGPLPGLDLAGIDWVIVGGESGPGARPMHPEWARSIRDQCVSAGVAFFFKQWGAWVGGTGEEGGFFHPASDAESFAVPTNQAKYKVWGEGFMSIRVGKKAAGRILDGRTWDEMPKAPHRS